MANATIIGLDLAKNVFHAHGGVPPLKWSTDWDRIIPFQEDQRWQESETNPKRSC